MLASLGGWGLGLWEEIPHPSPYWEGRLDLRVMNMALLPPTEPPHWGVNKTNDLLERVVGENASLPCPAQGEAKPRVGLGKQGWPGFQELGYHIVASLGYRVPPPTL